MILKFLVSRQRQDLSSYLSKVPTYSHSCDQTPRSYPDGWSGRGPGPEIISLRCSTLPKSPFGGQLPKSQKVCWATYLWHQQHTATPIHTEQHNLEVSNPVRPRLPSFTVMSHLRTFPPPFFRQLTVLPLPPSFLSPHINPDSLPRPPTKQVGMAQWSTAYG